jgi:hypothetical protein
MKFYGAIGFMEDEVEVRPGVFRAMIQEYLYSGDYNRVSTAYKTSSHLNDDLSVSAEVSIVGDSHAFLNMNRIVYVAWRGSKWKVTNIDDAKHPRLILTLGGEYNDDRGSQTEIP